MAVDANKIRRAIQAPVTTAPTPAALSEASVITEPIIAPPPASPTKTTRAKHHTKPTPVTPAPQSSEAMVRTKSINDPSPVDPVLFTIRQLGRLLDDIEQMRIMNGNRIAAGHREGIDQPWMDMVGAQLDGLEHTVELELKRAWRKHRLAAWAKSIPGAGEVLMARLIAEIGEPADRPNPGKLLAYCGHGDPARAGQVPKGATQEELFARGSPAAKKATWKLAYQFMRTVGTPPIALTESKDDTVVEPASAIEGTASTLAAPVRARSPYRDIYDHRKTVTEGKLHQRACKRCGPAGHPALPGSPWSDAHRHADALRIVGKRFLIDLWVASRSITETDNQTTYGREAQ